MMDHDNPFASPLETEPRKPVSAGAPRFRRPVTMGFVGMGIGGGAGGITGAVAGFALISVAILGGGLPEGAKVGSMRITPIFGAMLGGFIGGWTGMGIGIVLGLKCGLTRDLDHVTIRLGSALLAALVAVAYWNFGADVTFLASGHDDLEDRGPLMTGLPIGLFFGGGGGWLLAIWVIGVARTVRKSPGL